MKNFFKISTLVFCVSGHLLAVGPFEERAAAAELQLKLVQQKELDELAKIRQDIDKIADNLVGKNPSWVARHPKTALAVSALAGSAVTVAALRYLPALHKAVCKK